MINKLQSVLFFCWHKILCFTQVRCGLTAFFGLTVLMSLMGCLGEHVSHNSIHKNSTDPVNTDNYVNAEKSGMTQYYLTSSNAEELQKDLGKILYNPNTPEGSIIYLPNGYFQLLDPIRIGIKGITLQGVGMGNNQNAHQGTILDFSLQKDSELGGSGSEGVQVLADNVTLKDLAVVNAVGDGIKAMGIKNITIDSVRVEWLGEVSMANGGYGIYPVLATGVVVKNSFVRGASDAGIYVGQSHNILVQENYVTENVAGIEIENSQQALVLNNRVVGNTGGILVFDLPDIQLGTKDNKGIAGRTIKIEGNHIDNNNTRNFAQLSNIVALTPPGTGLLVMSSDQVEIYNNEISNHRSIGVIIFSYFLVRPFDLLDEFITGYDSTPERIFIHENTYINNSYDPIESAHIQGTEVKYISGDLQKLFSHFGGMPEIIYGGLGERLYEKTTEKNFNSSQKTCIVESQAISVGEIFGVGSLLDVDLAAFVPKPAFNQNSFNCQHPELHIDIDPKVLY